MYSTCLFCQQDLGRNESLENFPVGRRLAYDPDKGRLWVVCRSCARWNLTPLEERWEAIEEAERRFRDSRLRAGSGMISLARLPEGTELVRVGRAPELELAAWRYGDQFGRRRKRAFLVTGALLAGGAVAVGGALSAGLGGVTAFQLGRAFVAISRRGAPWTTVARLRTPEGKVLRVRPFHLGLTTIAPAADGSLKVTMLRSPARQVRPRDPPLVFRGEEARQVLGRLLPATNRLGGTEDEVRSALGRLQDWGSGEEFFSRLAKHAQGLYRRYESGGTSWGQAVREGTLSLPSAGLYALPPSLALATEMAANEERERQALEGDLAALEREWREAEELANIADDLLLPDGVAERMARLQGRRRGG